MSAHRLLKIGYLDQAGNIIRQIGETANLFYLFMESHDSYVEWQNASENARREKFNPSKVRRRLTDLALPQPLDNKRYQLLSEALVHVSPSLEPRSHNHSGEPAIGSNYRPAVSLAAIRSLSTMACILLNFGAELLQRPDYKERVLDACTALIESLDSIDTESIRRRADECLEPSEF